jgi:hypothetical protein
MTKKFKDIVEILNDPTTRRFILEEITFMYEHKSEVHEKLSDQLPVMLADQTQLKKTVWESLQDKGMLTLPEIGYEYIRIRNKSSELSFRERKIIEAICKKAIGRTIRHYNITPYENQKVLPAWAQRTLVAVIVLSIIVWSIFNLNY